MASLARLELECEGGRAAVARRDGLPVAAGARARDAGEPF